MAADMTLSEYADLMRQTANTIDQCLQEDGSTVVPPGYALQQQNMVLFVVGAVEKRAWVACEHGHQMVPGKIYRLLQTGLVKDRQSTQELVDELKSTLEVMSPFSSQSMEKLFASDLLKDKEIEIRRLPYGKWKKYVAFQDFDSSYAMRLVPRKPQYVPFTYADREQLRGKVLMAHDGNSEMCLTHFSVEYANGMTWQELLDLYVFLDTKQPVGKPATE